MRRSTENSEESSIKCYTHNQSGVVLESDLAGEFPLYLYWPQDQSTLLHSTSITELLNDARVAKPLKVSTEGLSFLLQSGVVPPPKTVYQDIYILGIGDQAKVSSVNGKIDIDFSHEFPFLKANRLQVGEMIPDEDLILQMLAEATISRIDESKPSFLFHSAGKDSNSIALALAEAGWQDKLTLITHKSKGQADESEISAKIAKQLGFRHQILLEVDQPQSVHMQDINEFFVNTPFPSTDNVSLAYPLYMHQLPELKYANIIDGGGNDSHMMTPPSARESKVLPISKLTHHASAMRWFVRSESLFSSIIRTPAERCGMSGLSFSDTKTILPKAMNVYPHWRNECQRRKDWDLFDFKTSILTSVTACELHIRKVRNFADSISSNVILPFANQRVAGYFAKMPEQHLLEPKALKNKIILRKILKDHISLDCDSLGKFGFTYDSGAIVDNCLSMMVREIYDNTFFDTVGVDKVLSRFVTSLDLVSRSGFVAKKFVYRLYLISAWCNRCKYLKKGDLI